MFGFRADGKKVKNLDPIQRMMPHIMTSRADATIKIDFTGHESLPEIRDRIDEVIKKNVSLDAKNGTDTMARLFSIVPNFMIAFLVGTLKFLDMHGLLPKAVLDLLPFHCTAFVTNLKSIKGPSIYHHIYNFGNTGMFFAMGKESQKPVVRKGEIVVGKMLPLRIVTDERFCDGFYFVNALKQLRALLADPDSMMEPLAELPQDTVVQHAFNRKKRQKDQAE